MTSVGTYLRDLRERRGVPLAEIARTTRVAQRYLESLEADDHSKLPAPVFTRGYVRAYCQALGEAPDEALACYDGRDGRPPAPPARPAPVSRARESRSRSTVVASLVLLVVLGMALFTVALVIQPRDRAERLAGEPRPTPPPATAPTTPEPAAAAPAPPSQVAATPPAPAAPIVTPPSPSTPPAAVTPAPQASRPSMAPPPTAAPPLAAPAPAPVAAPGSAPRPLTGLSQPPAPAAVATPAPSPALAPRPTATPAPAATPPAVTARPAPPATPAATTSPASPAVTDPGMASARPPAAVPNLESVGGVVSPYRLVARTNEATWIRVRTEDGRSSEENVPAGEVREWVSDRPFVLTIGNAGGVSFELNGRTLPPLGGRGAVIPRLVLPPDNR